MAPLHALFAIAIGSYLAEAISLSATRDVRSVLPVVHEVLEKPTEAFQKMNSHLTQLGQRMSEVETKMASEMAKQKADYEQRLHEQADGNRRIQAANHQLYNEIEVLKHSSASLRQEANKQASLNHLLRSDLQTLQKNMTSAEEFTSLALEAAEANLSNASQLNVLRELDAADVARAHETEHERRLMSVTKLVDLALLDTSATLGATPHPSDMIQQLQAVLGDLVREKNASAEALKAAFEKEFQTGNELRQYLLKEQTHLNATKLESSTLNNQLKEAVNHLRATGGDLIRRKESIQAFLNKIAVANEASGSTAQNKSEQPRNTQSPITFPSAAKGKVNEQQESHGSQLRAIPNLGAVMPDKGDEEDSKKIAMPTATSANNMEQWTQQIQTNPGNEKRSALVTGRSDIPQKAHEKTNEKGRNLKQEKEAKLVKNETTKEKGKNFKHEKKTNLVKHMRGVKQAGTASTNNPGLAATGTEGKNAPDATRWLAPVENGIKWMLR